jgi:hypothetical protein
MASAAESMTDWLYLKYCCPPSTRKKVRRSLSEGEGKEADHSGLANTSRATLHTAAIRPCSVRPSDELPACLQREWGMRGEREGE